MRTKSVLIIAFLIFTGVLNAQNTMFYDTAWKKIDSLIEKSLPKSALDEVDNIYQQALSEKNSPQIIKALMQQASLKQMIDEESWPESIRTVEEYTQKTNDKIEKSVLYSLLADMYKDYLDTNRYKFRNRKNPEGYTPENIREWSAGNFTQKITEYVGLSLKESDLLQKTDALTYEALLTKGKDARFFRPTMYDFLAHQGIDLLNSMTYYDNTTFEDKVDSEAYFSSVANFIALPVNAEKTNVIANILVIYRQLLRFRSADNNKEALLMADLDRLNFVYNQANIENRFDLYLAALEKLEKEWEGKEISVEIMYQKALLYQQQDKPSKNDAERKQFQKELNKKVYDICREGIRKYKNYKRIGLLDNVLDDITRPTVHASTANTIYPNTDLTLTVQHTNLDVLSIKIYKIDTDVLLRKEYSSSSELYKKGGKLAKEISFKLKNEQPYEKNDTILHIPMDGVSSGLYEYVIEANKKVQSNSFLVSKLASLARKISDDNISILVVDRMSGKPLANTDVSFYDKMGSKQQVLIQSVKTDENGLALYSGKKTVQGYRVVSGQEATFLTYLPWGTYRDYSSSEKGKESISIFTDRGIYRPGQTVFFKAIAWIADKETSNIVPNKTYEVIFRDVNDQEISKKSFKTNEFGSFAGEFTIPQNILSGTFGISILDETQFITVAEYKRPNFKVDFQKIETTYSFGDSIKVKGNVTSFSGVPLQQVDVNYRVVRRPHFLYRWYPTNMYEKQIAFGKIKLNNDGSFTIPFFAEKEKTDNKENTFYKYEIIASVTDINGETQENRQYVSVGDKSMYLEFSLDNKVDKAMAVPLKINAQNLNGMPIKTTGTYTLYRLTDNKKLAKSTDEAEVDVPYYQNETPKFNIDKEISSGNFSSNDSLSLNWKNLESGRYRILAKAKDEKGNEIKEEKDFILYGKNDKKPPVLTYNWLIEEKTTCKPGENAVFSLGSSAENVSVLYELFKEKELLERKRFTLNNENKQFSIPYKKEYGDQVAVVMTFVKDEQFFDNSIALTKEKENKQLTLKFDVFRDKLLPGQKEEWKLTITDAQAKGVLSELLAGMYDASLDKIQGFNWYFNPQIASYYYTYSFTQDPGFNSQLNYLYSDRKRKNVPELQFDYLTKRNTDHLFYSKEYAAPLAMQGNSALRVRGMAKQEVAEDLVDALEVEASMAPPATGGQSTQSEATPQIRENFNETAFFFPQLKTNEKGETVLSFTMPESNTTWKFMGMAHTKDLHFGKLIAETMTQKDLMVIPNMPRFLRQGDKVTISTKIANLSDKVLGGKVSIEFFNPVTNELVAVKTNQIQDFSIEKGNTGSASWTFDVPEGIDMIGCRIVAKEGNMSDGEQHILPVLPNRILITESLPIAIRGNQSKDFTLKKLTDNQSKTLSNYRLTFEFTENPVWYAIQALPTLSNPTVDNAISWFSSYYTNILAGHIVRENPEIKQIVNVWKKQSSEETLTSALEKNQELKGVLLSETPWVMDAKNEGEQKRQLSLLFDENRQSQLTKDALQKLKDLQHDDGGWMWFNGMYPSRYVTTYILENMHRLIKLSAIQYGEDEKRMQMNALRYLDEQIAKDYNELKKVEKDLTKSRQIDDMQMYYLCVRSCYLDIPITGDALAAYKFYGSQAEKYRKELTLYGKAQAAMYFKKQGKAAIAKELLQSLKEHSTTNEEMGMFWANNKAGYFWNQAPIMVETIIMEAFNEVGDKSASKQDLEEMKIWLLKQKQTQSWDAEPSTVNAIYALLMNNTGLVSSGEQVQIQLGKQTIDTKNKEAGTGYIKQTFEKGEISSDKGNVKVTKNNDGIAWGALYWQYFENLDQVTGQAGSLTVDKKLFIERTTPSGVTIEPVSGNNTFTTGDKAIIRLTVKTDRDMEYVHLKDMRAGCFEPVEQLSGIRWKEGLIYYQDVKDASTNFYFNYLPKGTYVFEYPVWINRVGEYTGGIATIQCMYAPEFVSHTAGEKVTVK